MSAYKYGLTKKTIDSIHELFLDYPAIEKVVLYGSRATGNYRPGSDIDLTLMGKQLTYAQLSQIETKLEELMLPYSIDLSLFHHIDNQDLIEHIKQKGMDFYTNYKCFTNPNF